MASHSIPHLSPEEYVELERAAETKSEYYRGEIFAMAGASFAHNIIVSNLVARLHERLRKRDCAVLSSDARLTAKAAGLYTYPDVMVICGKPAFTDAYLDTVTNPILVIKVLSRSTREYDRGSKNEIYRAIPSLLQYVTVAQDRAYAEVSTRQPDDRWMLEEVKGAGSIIFESLGMEVSLSDVYEKSRISSWLVTRN